MNTYLFAALVLLVQAVSATLYPYKSTYYGCPDECKTQERPRCEHGLPSNKFFVALHEKYFRHADKFCDNYYVGMVIDSKASGELKVVRAKVVDECGTCAETQVDLSQTAFEHLAKKSTGVINMIYVIVDAHSKEIIEGPIYNSSALSEFAKAKGVSKSTIVNSFKQAARAMSGSDKGMRKYPWEDGSFAGGDDDDEEEHEEKKTTRKATPKTTHKTTSRKTTTTVVKKTSALPTVAKPTVKPTAIPAIPIQKPDNITALPLIPVNNTKPADKPAPIQKPLPKPEEKEHKKPAPKPEEKPAPKPEEKEIDDFDKENGGTDAPVTAGVIGGTAAIVGAAGVGLLMLKRKSPQKYDELKQKFPEAFGTVKRSITRGASTIKRGVSRSVSRRNNQQTTPLPASYTFTLNTEDGLPRVALYDDPYPTKTNGNQHW